MKILFKKWLLVWFIRIIVIVIYIIGYHFLFRVYKTDLLNWNFIISIFIFIFYGFIGIKIFFELLRLIIIDPIFSLIKKIF